MELGRLYAEDQFKRILYTHQVQYPQCIAARRVGEYQLAPFKAVEHVAQPLYLYHHFVQVFQLVRLFQKMMWVGIVVAYQPFKRSAVYAPIMLAQ